MKKVFLFLFLAASFSSFAQIRKIPAAVTEAFKSKYPNASNVEWRDKLTLFMGAFEDGGKKYEARFNNKGGWLQTEDEIKIADLPGEVKEGLSKSKYADWDAVSFYHLQFPENKIQYTITVKKNDFQKKNLLFSSSGQLLKDNITL